MHDWKHNINLFQIHKSSTVVYDFQLKGTDYPVINTGLQTKKFKAPVSINHSHAITKLIVERWQKVRMGRICFTS